MKKLLLASVILMSFACNQRVSICNKSADCNDEISDADLDRCIEDAEETEEEYSKFNNPECDDFLAADQDYVSCVNANGECDSNDQFTTTQCDDEFDVLLEESLRLIGQDCDG